MQSLFAYLLCLNVVIGERLIELNHDLSSDSLRWPTKGGENFKFEPLFEGYKIYGWYSSFQFSGPEHLGTHLDAPYHFNENGWKVDEIPFENLIAPGVMIDIEEKVRRIGPTSELTAEDIEKWIADHGSFPNNSIILINTGWSDYYNKQDEAFYFGKKGDGTLEFPGLSPAAAKFIVKLRELENLHVVGVGLDTASIDAGSNVAMDVHRILSAANIFQIENLKDLRKLPPTEFELVVMPMKIKGGSGAPSRVFARIPQDSNSDRIPRFSAATSSATRALDSNITLFLSLFVLCSYLQKNWDQVNNLLTDRLS